MPIYKMSSRDRRALRNRRLVMWAKWVAIVLSATLLAATLLLVRAQYSLINASGSPASVEVGQPITAR